MKITSKITSDKILLILFLIIVILGIFIRFNNFEEVGYWNDDQAALPAGLMWFYPHDYFPGLNYGNPPLGDLIIGAGCMLSGEDFSAVSQVKPFFYPDRFDLLGGPLSNADTQCHIPMYVFGLIFFILIIIFAFTFLGRYSAFFLTAFFAFYSTILLYSRWIKVDIIFWVFEMAFLIFLLKFYKSNGTKNLILAASFLGLAFATKFTAAMLFMFAIFILLEKYKEEFLSILKVITKKLGLSFLENLEYRSPKKLISKTFLFSIVFALVSLIPYKLNPKNLLATRDIFQQFNQNLGSTKFSIINIFITLKEFLLSLNVIDTLLFIFSLYILVMIVKKREKTKLEKFILFLFITFIITALLFPVIAQVNRVFPFTLSILFLFALAFSDKEYSLFNKLKITNKKTFFSIFLIIYIIFSSFIAISASPYFVTKNHLVCPIFPEKSSCKESLGGFETKAVANYLEPLLNEEETFIGYEGVLFFYIKPNQGLADFQFYQVFLQNFGREPNFLDKLQYFRPNNQTIRYLILPPDYKDEPQVSRDFKQNYLPLKTITLKEQELTFIYDLQNLQEKSTN